MKKTLSFILVFILLISPLTLSFAGTDSSNHVLRIGNVRGGTRVIGKLIDDSGNVLDVFMDGSFNNTHEELFEKGANVELQIVLRTNGNGAEFTAWKNKSTGEVFDYSTIRFDIEDVPNWSFFTPVKGNGDGKVLDAIDYDTGVPDVDDSLLDIIANDDISTSELTDYKSMIFLTNEGKIFEYSIDSKNTVLIKDFDEYIPEGGDIARDDSGNYYWTVYDNRRNSTSVFKNFGSNKEFIVDLADLGSGDRSVSLEYDDGNLYYERNGNILKYDLEREKETLVYRLGVGLSDLLMFDGELYAVRPNMIYKINLDSGNAYSVRHVENNSHGLASLSGDLFYMQGNKLKSVFNNKSYDVDNKGVIIGGTRGRVLSGKSVLANDTITSNTIVTSLSTNDTNFDGLMEISTDFGDVTIDSNGVYSYDVTSVEEALLNLNSENLLEDIVYYQIKDNSINSEDSAKLTILVDVLSDVTGPIAFDDTGDVSLNSDKVTIDILDNDELGDYPNITNTNINSLVGNYGSLEKVSDGYIYTLDKDNIDVKNLSNNDILNDTFTYELFYGDDLLKTEAQLNIRISGLSLPETLDDNVSINNDEKSITFNVLDNDILHGLDSDVTVIDETVTSTYGDFVISEDGSVEFILDSNDEDVLNLSFGDIITDTATYSLDYNGSIVEGTINLSIFGNTNSSLNAQHKLAQLFKVDSNGDFIRDANGDLIPTAELANGTDLYSVSELETLPNPYNLGFNDGLYIRDEIVVTGKPVPLTIEYDIEDQILLNIQNIDFNLYKDGSTRNVPFDVSQDGTTYIITSRGALNQGTYVLAVDGTVGTDDKVALRDAINPYKSIHDLPFFIGGYPLESRKIEIDTTYSYDTLVVDGGKIIILVEEKESLFKKY